MKNNFSLANSLFVDSRETLTYILLYNWRYLSPSRDGIIVGTFVSCTNDRLKSCIQPVAHFIMSGYVVTIHAVLAR